MVVRAVVARIRSKVVRGPETYRAQDSVMLTARRFCCIDRETICAQGAPSSTAAALAAATKAAKQTAEVSVGVDGANTTDDAQLADLESSAWHRW